VDGLWTLLRHDDGHLALPRLLRYMAERKKRRARWVGAMERVAMPMALINGSADPVSGAHAAARWRDLLLAPTDDWHMEDQRGFNQLVMTNFYPTVAADEAARPVSEMDMTSPTPTFPRGSVVFAANRSLLLHPLPARRFCSGHTFFVQQSGRRELCTNVHVTFCEGGIHGKLWRLIEAGMWSLHPKGYFDTGRFLTITPPAIPTPYPPARIEPYNQCQARQASGGAIDPVYHGWWSPGGAAAAAHRAEPSTGVQQAEGEHGGGACGIFGKMLREEREGGWEGGGGGPHSDNKALSWT
jgi:hypothetical protein